MNLIMSDVEETIMIADPVPEGVKPSIRVSPSLPFNEWKPDIWITRSLRGIWKCFMFVETALYWYAMIENILTSQCRAKQVSPPQRD